MTALRHRIVTGDSAGLARAAAALDAGGLVAFPTETVYGLGGDARNDRAVGKIYAAKQRPSFNPLIVHVGDIEAARELARFTPLAETLAARFWPGALTMVLRRRQTSGLSLLLSAGLDTVALRVPSHPIARALLGRAGCPIAAPSANRSGRVSPTTARHVADALPGLDDGGPAIIVDGGRCPVGLESTVIDLSTAPPTILRPGGVTQEDLEPLTGVLADATADASEEAPKSPGMLARHYAPATPLRLNAVAVNPGEILLAFGPHPPDAPARNLSPSGDLIEAAANLFAMLRDLDAEGHAGIAVMTIPEFGLGRAINDRLRRAATPA